MRQPRGITVNSAVPERQQRGPAKRRAILDGARTVFGRDGYTRASIEAIAAELGVSTRTIYNHFNDKQRLFEELIVESATEVRSAQLAEIERHLGKIEDLRADLKALGLAFVSTQGAFPAHFALVRQIQAEAGHLPPETLKAWKEAGPKAVRLALAEAFTRLTERGLLAIEDAERAAYQFIALVSSEFNHRSFDGREPMDSGEKEEIVEAGVATFLSAFAAASPC